MKKTAFVLALVLMLMALTPAVSAASANLEVSGAQLTAKAGDTVDIAISIGSNPGFAFLNLFYVLDDGLTLNSVTNKVSTLGFAHDVTSVWDNSSNYTGTGELAILSVTLADDIEDGTYEIKIQSIEAYNDGLDDVSVTTASALITVGESAASTVIDDNITVFESKLTFAPESSATTTDAIVTFAKGEATLDLLFVERSTGALMIKNADGTLCALYNKDGVQYKLNGSTATNIAVIYNDIKGNVRYYVGEKVAYLANGESYTMANDITIYNTFKDTTGTETVTTLDGVTANNNLYNIGDSGTAEIVAFQDHTEANRIRILSGVDMPWYASIGYEVEVYADGVGQGKKTVVSDTIFSSIVANGDDVYATEYGHNYFAAFEIDGVDVSDGREYYMVVKPYTSVGTTKYYGTSAKINIDTEGKYSFDESY